MTLTSGTLTSAVGGHLAAVTACLVEDAYRNWNSAAAEVDRALDGWAGASADVSPLAEAAYRAAVEQEERAARQLERMLDVAERVLPVEQQ
ncbi:hypothetical protein [Amycolatopsis thermoflava]|uniref:Uncharacterized protein n=1 Tax=Amycolatopsis thermoflava TaxID=84480 RepID=A0A3N2GP83_9PSEU|nr:hypothetical protein [Amycolatopsis thermoflava]ROS38444.1 hypothetical protein EDD35_0720 [Amycolatopsis thermoflava]